MKKHFFILCMLALSTSFVLADITRFCSPNGAGSHNGLDFDNAFSMSELIYDIDGMNLQNVKLIIKLSKGNYYDNLVLNYTTVPNFINNSNSVSVEIYGGFDPGLSEDLNDRNLISSKTTFHANNSNSPISLDLASITTGNICIVDGIRIDSKDPYGNIIPVNKSAMILVGGYYLVSQCVINEFFTSNTLLFVEGDDDTFNIINTVISKCKASNLVKAYGQLNFLNSTIVCLSLTDDLIGLSSDDFHYNMFNSIIYDMDNWNNTTPVYYEIYNSIIGTYNNVSWMADYGNNFWNTNPLFTDDSQAPFSCLTASDASYNGDSMFIISLDNITNGEATDILFYDVVNHERFGNMADTSHLDIGAYQHYSNNTYYFQPQYQQAPRRFEEHDETGSIVNNVIYNLFGQPVDETYHGIVIKNGQKVLQ